MLALFVGATVFIIRFAAWIGDNFGVISFEQILFHVGAETTGTPWRLIQSGLRELLAKPLLSIILGYIIASLLFRRWGNARTAYYLAYGCAGIFACGGAVQFWQVSGLSEYVADSALSHLPKNFDWVNAWYVKPKVHLATGSKPKNLIWLYVESLEDYRVSPQKHPKLAALKSIKVNTYQYLPGTTWTIGGMVSSQCGIPLLPFGLYSGNGFSDVPFFLKKAPCLGDVLKDNGYRLEFIGGADQKFAGKGTFLKNHGFSNVVSKKQIAERTGQPLPKDAWGYPDDVIFQIALEDIKWLKQSEKPFFLSMLTLDTHGPKGNLSEHCRNKGYVQETTSIFDCVISQTEEFIDKLQQSGVLEDTVLVVSGDHSFMGPKKSALNLLASQKDKDNSRLFFTIIHPEGKKIMADTMNHFDMFPTVLSSLGYEIEHNAAGLGHNLYEMPSLSSEHSINEIRKALRTSSKGYLSFWD